MKHYRQQVTTVAFWEFMRFFKWKQELIAYGLMLAIGVGVWGWKSFIADDNKQITLAVEQTLELPAHERFNFEAMSRAELEQAEARLGEGLDAIVYLEGQQVLLKVAKKAKWQPKFNQWLTQVYRNKNLVDKGLQPAELPQLLNPFSFAIQVKGEEQKSTSDKSVAEGFLMLMMVSVFTAFAYAFTSITTEKQQRVTEQLLSSMSVQAWMDGKILGFCLLCIKGMVTFGLIMLMATYGVALLKDTGAVNIVGLNAMNIGFLILFSLMGLLLWNSFLAAFASTIDDPNHSSRTTIMFVPAIPLFLAYTVIDIPQSIAMQFLSLFPLTSFAAMPLRMAETQVPWWQIGLSVVLLGATIYWARQFAARIFTMGIMMYGKEPSWKEIGRCLTQKV